MFLELLTEFKCFEILKSLDSHVDSLSPILLVQNLLSRFWGAISSATLENSLFSSSI